MKTYTVTFHAMNGDPLGQLDVEAKTSSKAMVLASAMFVGPWVSQSAKAAEAPTVTLPDGYNGNTETFFTAPMERDGDLVKLQCAAPGKQYLFTWRAAAEVASALESQA